MFPPFPLKDQPTCVAGGFCAAASCHEQGLFRAPQNRFGGKNYYWFCLEHIRAYNAAWDYFEGFSSDEITFSLCSAARWDRPSWPFGHTPRSRTQPHAGVNVHPRIQAALNVLGLVPPVEMREIRQRYLFLMKRYHPDLNHGARDAEERVKIINEAYEMLMSFFEKAA